MPRGEQPTAITVIKLDHDGHEVWRYSGVVLARGETGVQLEAHFNRDDHDAGYVVFRRGDRYIEWFYADRMFNIFQIHDVDDDHLKGWYCNICNPADISDHEVRCEDLALDVWVAPSGELQVLDEDEFAALPIDVETRARALSALDQLRDHIRRGDYPFGTNSKSV
jgi:predicted RNA-binding protein associated with RNAse of E/G family